MGHSTLVLTGRYTIFPELSGCAGLGLAITQRNFKNARPGRTTAGFLVDLQSCRSFPSQPMTKVKTKRLLELSNSKSALEHYRCPSKIRPTITTSRDSWSELSLLLTDAGQLSQVSGWGVCEPGSRPNLLCSCAEFAKAFQP